MKRIFHIALLCACALLGFVSNAEAQTTGNIVTISFKSGNTTNYLAVDEAGTAIQNSKKLSENCYWRVTVSGSTYTFQSIISGLYLYAERTGSKNNYTYTLKLEDEPANFTKSSSKYTANYCAISFSDNSWKGASSNSGTKLTLTTINGFTRDFLTVAPTPYDGTELTELEELTTITLTAKTGVVIDNDSFTKNSFTLTGPTGASASISNVTASDNVLTITVANGDSEGTYTLNIPKGAVEDQYGISFAAATYSWKVSNSYHKFTSVTPAEGVTQAFNTITLTTDV